MFLYIFLDDFGPYKRPTYGVLCPFQQQTPYVGHEVDLNPGGERQVIKCQNIKTLTTDPLPVCTNLNFKLNSKATLNCSYKLIRQHDCGEFIV